MNIDPMVVILAALVLVGLLFFRDALSLSVSRPGRRFDLVHPWEKWLHPAKVVVIGVWLWIRGATDLDRPLFGGLPDRGVVTIAWAGVGLALAGLAFMVWGRLTLGAQFASRLALHENHILVTTGPYQLTRHPLYTGALLVFWGVVLAGDSMAGLLTWGGFFTAMIYAHTVAEEDLLERRFGEIYRSYKRAVPRLVPFA